MIDEDLVLLVAKAIEPCWFWETVYDPSWGCERHGLDNHPHQHEHHRAKAIESARNVLTALKEEAERRNIDV